MRQKSSLTKPIQHIYTTWDLYQEQGVYADGWACSTNRTSARLCRIIVWRPGNAAPARGNLEFIQQCEQSLPDGCFVQALRIDAAGYQAKIIQYCDEKDIPHTTSSRHPSQNEQDNWSNSRIVHWPI